MLDWPPSRGPFRGLDQKGEVRQGSTDKDAQAGSTVKVRRRSLVTYLRGDKSIEPLGARP